MVWSNEIGCFVVDQSNLAAGLRQTRVVKRASGSQDNGEPSVSFVEKKRIENFLTEGMGLQVFGRDERNKHNGLGLFFFGDASGNCRALFLHLGRRRRERARTASDWRGKGIEQLECVGCYVGTKVVFVQG